MEIFLSVGLSVLILLTIFNTFANLYTINAINSVAAIRPILEKLAMTNSTLVRKAVRFFSAIDQTDDVELTLPPQTKKN